MAIYFTQPITKIKYISETEWWETSTPPHTMTVHEAETNAVDTGLLNAHGETLYRKHDIELGFNLKSGANQMKKQEPTKPMKKPGKGGRGC